MSEAFQKVSEIVVSEHEAGQRLDNFLLKKLKGVPKSRIYRIVRKGEVRVNKGRIKVEYRIQTGDVVRIPPIRVSEPSDKPDAYWLERGQELEDAILIEDEFLMIMNKPAGWAVHGGSGVAFGVIDIMRALRPHQPFLELGHRLDRETSGCLVLPKQRSILKEFQQLLQEGKVDKTYRTLLLGEWQGGQKTVRANLEKSYNQKVRVTDEGKESDSTFKLVKRYGPFSLMNVDIGTGRTHQIRVHAEHLEMPVAGDRKYGDFEINRELQGIGLKRLFLHAVHLRFRLPKSGNVYEVKAPVPQDLREVLSQLEDE